MRKVLAPDDALCSRARPTELRLVIIPQRRPGSARDAFIEITASARLPQELDHNCALTSTHFFDSTVHSFVCVWSPHHSFYPPTLTELYTKKLQHITSLLFRPTLFVIYLCVLSGSLMSVCACVFNVKVKRVTCGCTVYFKTCPQKPLITNRY